MGSEQVILTLLDRILEKQDQTMSRLSEHTHILANVKDQQCDNEEVHAGFDKRLTTLEKEHREHTCTTTASVEKQKAWVPVVLKIIELIAVTVGVLLGVKTVL